MEIIPSARWKPERAEERMGHRPALGKLDRRSPTGWGSAQGQSGLLWEERRVISTSAGFPPREAALHIPTRGAQHPSFRSSPGSLPLGATSSERSSLIIIPELLLLLFPITEPSFLPLHDNFKLFIYFCVYGFIVSLPD